MNTSNQGLSHEQAALLLPWLANDTLSAEEHDAVLRHLHGCGECSAELQLLEQMQLAINDDTLAPIVPAADPVRLLDSVPRRRRDRSLYAMAASALLAAIALFALFAIPDSRDPVLFETATSSNATSEMHYRILLEFSPGIAEEQRQSLFTDMAAFSIVALEDNRYSATIPLTIGSPLRLGEIRAEIAARPGVIEAEFIAMQTPVEVEP